MKIGGMKILAIKIHSQKVVLKTTMYTNYIIKLPK